MNRIIIIAACMLSLLISCNSSKEQDSGITVDISTTSPSTGYDWLAITDTTIVPLETTEASLIGRIAQISSDASGWYVLTREGSILKFDKAGKFIASIGSKGNGPGEWMRINTMCMQDNKLYIIEGNQNKVCIYDTSGKWIEDIAGTECLKFAISMQPVGNGKFLVANGLNFVENTPLYGIWDSSAPQQLTTLVSSAYTSNGNYGWAINPSAAYHGDHLALKPLSSTVFKLNVNASECDSLINVMDCLPADIPASGDYMQAFSAALKLKGNPIMSIHTAGDFAFLYLLRGFAIVHLPSGKWYYADVNGRFQAESPLPFIATPISCTVGDSLVCVVDASTYLNTYAEKPEFKRLLNTEIDPEDNPVLMIYSIEFSEER